jgi:hypothetical protein
MRVDIDGEGHKVTCATPSGNRFYYGERALPRVSFADLWKASHYALSSALSMGSPTSEDLCSLGQRAVGAAPRENARVKRAPGTIRTGHSNGFEFTNAENQPRTVRKPMMYVIGP